MQESWVYDLETFPNCFTMAIVREDGKHLQAFEVSDRINQTDRILACLRYLKDGKHRMVGFNNLGFDYPILHQMLQDAITSKKVGKNFSITAKQMYRLAQKQIESFKGDGFGHTIKVDEQIIKQVDLFKIHHFDNKARSTSLKMLEFNMRSDNIEDLPFPVGKRLTPSEIDVLLKYNKHDVMQTLKFFESSKEAVDFRAKLSDQYKIDFTNFNDTKIGKEYFINRLEQAIPGSCYKMTAKGRKINQTPRDRIRIKDCLFDYYNFTRPEFKAIQDWFSRQVITETKGVFSDIDECLLGELAMYSQLTKKKYKLKTQLEIETFLKDNPMSWIETEELKATENLLDKNGEPVMAYPIDENGNPDLTKRMKKVKVPKKSYWGCKNVAETLNVVVDGFRLDFGTGGIHGSLTNTIVREDNLTCIKDADVSSMYPNIAISNRSYPLHLSEKFCDIYQDVYEQRKSFPKGSAENAVMKLALNGVYGDSNNQYSPFYDPQYTMQITINGQLSLCLLMDRLIKIEGLQIIQANTDGITVKMKRESLEEYHEVCKQWEKDVKLQLEFAEYKAMYLRDVNNYIAEYTNGKVKRKGAYQYEDLGWHQNQSSLVIPKAAEALMLHGTPLETFIREAASDNDNKWDFMLRTKVPRSSRLVMVMDDESEVQLQNICRYYPCKTGGKLIKIMPPLEEGKDERRLSIDSSWKVRECNDVTEFSFDDLDFDYYIQEAEKLVIDNCPK
jgi:hypothetical protein